MNRPRIVSLTFSRKFDFWLVYTLMMSQIIWFRWFLGIAGTWNSTENVKTKTHGSETSNDKLKEKNEISFRKLYIIYWRWNQSINWYPYWFISSIYTGYLAGYLAEPDWLQSGISDQDQQNLGSGPRKVLKFSDHRSVYPCL